MNAFVGEVRKERMKGVENHLAQDMSVKYDWRSFRNCPKGRELRLHRKVVLGQSQECLCGSDLVLCDSVPNYVDLFVDMPCEHVLRNEIKDLLNTVRIDRCYVVDKASDSFLRLCANIAGGLVKEIKTGSKGVHTCPKNP
jgi:hypothetical protein